MNNHRLNMAFDVNLIPVDILCSEPERDAYAEAATDATLHAEMLATLEHRAAFMRRAAALRAARLARD